MDTSTTTRIQLSLIEDLPIIGDDINLIISLMPYTTVPLVLNQIYMLA